MGLREFVILTCMRIHSYAHVHACVPSCMFIQACGFSAQRRTDPLPHELLQFKPGDTPKLGIINSIVHLGDTKAQETGHLAVGPEFEPRVGSVGTAIVAVVASAMASSFREQRGQTCCMGDLSAVQKSGAQLTLGRREALAPLLLSGRARNTRTLSGQQWCHSLSPAADLSVRTHR